MGYLSIFILETDITFSMCNLLTIVALDSSWHYVGPSTPFVLLLPLSSLRGQGSMN